MTEEINKHDISLQLGLLVGRFDSIQSQYTLIQTALNAVEERMRSLEQALASMKEVKPTVEDHETRIRKMEKTLWIAFGAATVISTTLSIVAPIILKHI